jgi:exonuclease SbcD
MKFLHTADWHIGRTLNGFSLLSEQEYAFSQIEAIAQERGVDAIIIAGDLYDRSVPPTEAVKAFNHMISSLAIGHRIPVFAISGNHDGANRLNFGHEFFKRAQFYLNTKLEDAIRPIEFGDTQVFLLPFIDPIDVRVYYGKQGEDEETLKGYSKIGDAIARVVQDMKAQFKPDHRHILVTHFSVLKKMDDQDQEAFNAQLSSETSSTVGGLASVTSDLFSDFDYVALGHIHTRFASPSETIAYSGSPIAFNTKEAKMAQEKGVYIVDVTPEGVQKEFVPLKVQKPIVVLEENYDTLIDPTFYEKQPRFNAWFSFQLMDYGRKKMMGINVRAELENIYGPDIVELVIAEQKRDQPQNRQKEKTASEIAPEQLIGNFYSEMTNHPLSDYQRQAVDDILTQLRKD